VGFDRRSHHRYDLPAVCYHRLCNHWCVLRYFVLLFALSLLIATRFLAEYSKLGTGKGFLRSPIYRQAHLVNTDARRSYASGIPSSEHVLHALRLQHPRSSSRSDSGSQDGLEESPSEAHFIVSLASTGSVHQAPSSRHIHSPGGGHRRRTFHNAVAISTCIHGIVVRVVY
jgi:hypothetical protein